MNVIKLFLGRRTISRSELLSAISHREIHLASVRSVHHYRRVDIDCRELSNISGVSFEIEGLFPRTQLKDTVLVFINTVIVLGANTAWRNPPPVLAFNENDTLRSRSIFPPPQHNFATVLHFRASLSRAASLFSRTREYPSTREEMFFHAERVADARDTSHLARRQAEFFIPLALFAERFSLQLNRANLAIRLCLRITPLVSLRRRGCSRALATRDLFAPRKPYL